MTKHTPTPWKAIPSSPNDGFECYWLTGNFGPHNAEKEIGSISGPQSGVQEANAAFIVKAVNSHDALVNALRRIEQFNGGQIRSPMQDIAKDALADVGSVQEGDK